jgi:hypothetical protein
VRRELISVISFWRRIWQDSSQHSLTFQSTGRITEADTIQAVELQQHQLEILEELSAKHFRINLALFIVVGDSFILSIHKDCQKEHPRKQKS